MTEEKAPWWKRFGLWIAAGLSAVVLFVLAAAKRQKPAAPPLEPLPPAPVLPTVVVPQVNTQPATTYNDNKVVVPTGIASKTRIARVLIGLQMRDRKKD